MPLTLTTGLTLMTDRADVLARKPHRCDETCLCAVHGTALIYSPAFDDHACQDSSCKYAHGGAPDDDVKALLSPGSVPDLPLSRAFLEELKRPAFAAEFESLPAAAYAAGRPVVASLAVTLERLQLQMLDPGAVFILPHQVLPGVTHVMGTPVVRADVERPMVAIPGA